MDRHLTSARLLGLLFKVNGKYLGKVYKQHLSGFRTWDQLPHAKRWMLEPDNVGERLSIDETSFSHGELYTIVSNKAGCGRRKSLVAVVEGTLASNVSERLLLLPSDRRLGVREVTMDFSDGMFGIVRTAFPLATIVIDCFHIMKRAGEGLEEMRLKLKRECRAEIRRQEREFRKKLRLSWKRRQAYLKAHPCKCSGTKRGRKPLRQNSVFVPEKLPNGETTVELLTRIRYPLCKC